MQECCTTVDCEYRSRIVVRRLGYFVLTTYRAFLQITNVELITNTHKLLLQIYYSQVLISKIDASISLSQQMLDDRPRAVNIARIFCTVYSQDGLQIIQGQVARRQILHASIVTLQVWLYVLVLKNIINQRILPIRRLQMPIMPKYKKVKFQSMFLDCLVAGCCRITDN